MDISQRLLLVNFAFAFLHFTMLQSFLQGALNVNYNQPTYWTGPIANSAKLASISNIGAQFAGAEICKLMSLIL